MAPVNHSPARKQKDNYSPDCNQAPAIMIELNVMIIARKRENSFYLFIASNALLLLCYLTFIFIWNVY